MPGGEGLRPALPGLLALALSVFVAITTEMLPVGLLPQMGRSLGVTEAQAGLLVSAYAAMVAVLALPLTLVTARLPRKPVLLATLVGYVLSNLVVAAAPSYALLAAGRAVGGLAHALFFSVVIAYGPRLVPPALVGRALSIVVAGSSLGTVVGIPLATALGAVAGWRLSFAAVAAVTVVLLVVVARLLPPFPGAPRRPGRRRGWWRPAILAVVAANTLFFLGHFTAYTFIAPLLLRAGAAETAVGPTLLLLGTAGILGLWAAGAAVDHRPRAAVLGAVGVVLLTLVGLAAGPVTLAWVVTLTALWSLAFGAVPTLVQAAALRARSVAPDTAGALINASANVGIGLGAVLGGLVLRHGSLGQLPWVAAAVTGLALLVVFVSRRGFPARP